jgi:hypothetical protein
MTLFWTRTDIDVIDVNLLSPIYKYICKVPPDEVE